MPYIDESFDGDVYYKNTIGVTVMNDTQIKEVLLKVDRYNAPYVLTKSFHWSQERVEELEDHSVIIKLTVHHNFELERLLLGFGEAVEVLKP